MYLNGLCGTFFECSEPDRPVLDCDPGRDSRQSRLDAMTRQRSDCLRENLKLVPVVRCRPSSPARIDFRPRGPKQVVHAQRRTHHEMAGVVCVSFSGALTTQKAMPELHSPIRRA